MIFDISGLEQNRVRKAEDRAMKASREGWAQWRILACQEPE